MSKVVHCGLSPKGVAVIKSTYKGIKFNPLMMLAMRTNGVKVSFKDDSLIFQSNNPVDASKLSVLDAEYVKAGLVKGVDYEVKIK
jgi:hypothetical protein